MFQKNRWFWIVAITGLVLDQATKYWTVKSFETVGDTLPILPGIFHITYVINTGAAFSAFRGGVAWLRWLSLLVSAGLMALAWFGPRLSKLEQMAYGFILAGALGNGFDRFLFGFVVDFLDFRLINFPVFNVADVCINIGILLLLLSTFPRKSSRSRPENEKDRP
ncbi:signal peptidase II [Pannus brasiliensis CCIBt3594]|uniref:Lipoprotein signal peptidase n=1 Tax=Pannus brasiliensis CCIBt3594 TaxID=1427578 RepID=A0AAW9QND2_9CHRO